MDYWQNNNYYSNPNETTNYISSTIEYAPPIICPTKNIYTSNTTTTTTTTSTNSNIYSYKTINTNKYQTNTHYKTQNETYSNYDEFYNIPPTYNDIIFTNGNQEQTKKNNNIIKAIENYGFHEIKETNPQFQKQQSGEIMTNKNNNIYYNEYTE